MEHSVEHHGSSWNKATLMDSDDSSQCTAKASLEKGSSRPSPGLQHIWGLVLTQPMYPTLWTPSIWSHGAKTHFPTSKDFKKNIMNKGT